MRKMLRVFVVVSAILSIGFSASPAHAIDLQDVWTFDNDTNYWKNSTSGGNSLYPAANFNGSIIAGLDATANAVYLPGWTTLNGLNQVDLTASSLNIAGDNNHYNIARGESFTFGATVKPLDPQPIINANLMKSGDTLNIMQKGLAGPNREQWKLSINYSGKYICSFRGPNASGVISEFKAVSKAYPYTTARNVTCNLNNNVITMIIKTGNVVNQTVTAAGPKKVENTYDVIIGKKPFDTNPADTFAGTIDAIAIRKTGSPNR